MITVALAHLLGRGVRLEVPEAVAIAQSLVEAPGTPAIDNVELASDGAVRCVIQDGAPTVAALASLLDALLPSSGVPAPLRYAVARATSAVVAPPFASVAEFSAALARFENGDRATVVKALIARAVPRRIEPTVRRTEPAAETVLRRAPYAADRTPPARSRSRVAAAVAALLLSAAAGFAGVALTRSRAPSDVAMPAMEQRATPHPATPEPVRATAGRVAPPPRRVDSQPPPTRVAPGARVSNPVRALPEADTPAFSPAFSSNGTALFFQTGGARDAHSAIAMAPTDRLPADDLRIMKVVDDGARNYHARPSPDGRLIAFDSDRDGERGIYLANRDGTDVHRVSGPGYAALPTWSPDGSRLAFVRAETGKPSVWNLWIQPLESGPARRVTDYRFGQTWSASWFPDGRRIAYSHEAALTILDLTSGEARDFASPVRGRLVRTPAVSPDGSKIVFQVLRAGAWMLDVADGSMHCILPDPTAEEFAWAPDGRRLAFHSRRDGEWGVFVVAPGSGAAGGG